MNLETFKALDLYGVRITCAHHLPPEFYVVDDWANPAVSHHPEWHSIWAIGESALYAHPTVLQKLGDDWKTLSNDEARK